MSKHTPGPWFIEQTTVYALNKERIQVNRFTASIDRGWGDDGKRIEQQEVEANAKLIAAAPELLEALQDLADDIAERFDMDSPSTNPGIKHCIDAARAAIAKATQ